MNEYKFDDFKDDEIDRIQKEIDRDLSGRITEERAAGPEEEEWPEVEIVYQPDTPSDDASAPLKAGDSPAVDTPAVTASDSDSFYMETVKNQKNKNKKFQLRKIIIAACIISLIGCPLAGISIGIGQTYASKYLWPSAGEEESKAFSFDNEKIAPISVAPNASSIIDDFSSIVELVEPSVVGITSVIANGSENSFFPVSRDREGKGSGIIFDEDSSNVYILTNYHVVTGANNVYVSVQGSEVVKAALVGAEEKSDLAVISIAKSDLAQVGVNSVKAAKFGSSEDMKVGDIVLAIGNALGEGNTATLGIVSAKNKEITIDNLTLQVMQTDAAINPGNSGGPLVNTRGEVVAINTAKFQYYEVEGTGYSITIDEAKPIIETLRNRTPKAFLGIQMLDMDEETANLYNLPAMGVLVENVISGCAAEKAGIKRSDIITGFNGKPVVSKDALSELISGCNVGDTVEIKLFRIDEGALTINVLLMERPVSSTF